MSRYKEVTVTSEVNGLGEKEVVIDLVDADGPPTNPARRKSFGLKTWTTVEVDESDVRAIHTKLSEIIAEWDA